MGQGDAADMIGCARTTIDKAIGRGELEVARMHGNRRMLRAVDVERWAAGPPRD